MDQYNFMPANEPMQISTDQEQTSGAASADLPPAADTHGETCAQPVEPIQSTITAAAASGVAPGTDFDAVSGSEPVKAPANEKQAAPPLPTMKRGKVKFPQASLREIVDRIRKDCAPSAIETFGAGRHSVSILPSAMLELIQLVHYGRWSPMNVYEQQFVGLCHIFEDHGRLNYAVTHFIPVYSLDRGRTHSTVSANGNNAALKYVNMDEEIYHEFESKHNRDEKGYKVDPWADYERTVRAFQGHTHPGLGCFFSPTDRNSNYSAVNFPAVTFVCDPIRKTMKAMVGMNGEEAKVIAFMPYASNDKKTARRRETVDLAPLAQSEPQTQKLVTLEQHLDMLSEICCCILRFQGTTGRTRIYHDLDDNTVIRLKLKVPK